MVKLLSGDPQWRNFTAMDEYYQNGPLPTWIGWYAAAFAAWFHAASACVTLVMELGIVWMLFSAAAVADCLLLHRDALGDWRDPDGELHVSELPGAGAGVFAAG